MDEHKPDLADEVDNIMDIARASSVTEWNILGKEIPKIEVVFFFQIILIYIVVIVCVINLSIDNGNSNLWTALLSSSLGYILPSPSMNKK